MVKSFLLFPLLSQSRALSRAVHVAGLASLTFPWTASLVVASPVKVPTREMGRVLVKAPAKPPVRPVRASAVAAEYVINVEDLVEIRVRNHETLNRVVTVRPDGRISFPRVGEVQASGRTASALSRDLKTRLSRTLNNVSVEIEVKQTRPRTARIIGAVKAPDAYKITGESRVLDLVAAAGGLSARQDRISGRLVRQGVVKPFSIAQAIAQPRSAANLEIRPDDIIMLDESQLPNQVTVAGMVGKPGVYELQDGLSVTGLLGQAGGAGGAASLKQAHVLRAGAPIALDLSGLGTTAGLAPEAARFRFQIGDVLVIPENRARVGVMGEVNTPGYYPLPERGVDATLLKMLAAAGGATAGADLKNATLTRVKNGAPETSVVDVEAMLKGEAPDNILAEADATLFVPKKTAQVHVIGQIGKPGAYPLLDNMNLMSLLSQAGSPLATAGLSKAYVLREGKQIPTNLYPVLIEGKLDEAVSGFRLRSDDVLVIPDISAQIHIIGQVARPGAYNLEDKLSVASLLAQAGNVSPGAALSQAYVLREGKQIPLDLFRFLVAGEASAPAASFKFQSGDVLVLPENRIRFAVMGQVGRPDYFAFPERAGDATVLKALSAAGGPLQDANLSDAGIIRKVRGKDTVIPINIDDILRKGKLASNVVLRPDDILYLPPKKRGFKWTDVIAAISPFGVLR